MTERMPREGSPERMARSADKYQNWIIEGITAAHDEQREIDLMTARLIAHALGRATGRASALADFGRTGEGNYDALREEYLLLYGDATTPPMIREWIDWLGTHLVERENAGSGRRFMNEHQAPSLDRLLVQSGIDVDGTVRAAHIPASKNLEEHQAVADVLRMLPEAQDPAFWAYLTLGDVDASSGNLAQSFQDNYIGEFESVDRALYGLVELEEWETDLRTFASERGLLPQAVSIDLDVIEAQTRDIYDLVEANGVIYVFAK